MHWEHFVRFDRKGPKTPCRLLLDVNLVKLREEKVSTILQREQGWLSEKNVFGFSGQSRGLRRKFEKCDSEAV